MQSVSQKFRTLYASNLSHVEVKAYIYTGTSTYVEYDNASIYGVEISRNVLPNSTPEVGGATSGEMKISILPQDTIPRGAKIKLFLRIATDDDASEWINKGTWYIDSRETSFGQLVTTFNCVDAMLMTEQTYPNAGTETWPKAETAVVNTICGLMDGVTLDSRTTLAGYNVEYPNDLTCREILGYIAAANGGNWTITDDNKLFLVKWVYASGRSDYNVYTNLQEYTILGETNPINKVIIWYDDENGFIAPAQNNGVDNEVVSGNDDGYYTLEVDCPWATQAMANNLLTLFNGWVYKAYDLTHAAVIPAAEMGDVITFDGISTPMLSLNVSIGGGFYPDISSPGQDEVDSEFPYQTQTQKAIQRKVTLDQPYFGVTISREEGLKIERSDNTSEALFNSQVFTMRAQVDGSMKDRIYFDPVKGDYIFDGVLGADAVFTDSLYAEMGDVSELTVDRVSTSKRVLLWGKQDSSDDNYLQIQDHEIQFITGHVDDPTQKVQATNRNGSSLYWQKEPDSYDSDGYPQDEDGKRIYATTEDTGHPIYTYVYTELVKASFAFDDESGTYVPMLTLGAGDTNGNTKGILHKAADAFDISFTDSNGNEQSIVMNSAGYMDIFGLRKPTVLDFSGWDTGSFSETVDGGATNLFSVSFDGSGNPIQITDGSGHVTTVVW